MKPLVAILLSSVLLFCGLAAAKSSPAEMISDFRLKHGERHVTTDHRGAYRLRAPREIAEPRHSSLYAPRDFDISPYFMVVKPTLARGFNYKDMQWADLLQVHTAQVPLAAETEGAIAQVA